MNGALDRCYDAMVFQSSPTRVQGFRAGRGRPLDAAATLWNAAIRPRDRTASTGGQRSLTARRPHLSPASLRRHIATLPVSVHAPRASLPRRAELGNRSFADDGSADGTAEIVSQFTEARIRCEWPLKSLR